MNAALLSFLSGPISALIRYAVTAAGTAVVAKGYTDGATASTVGAGVIAAASAILGALTSTKAANVAKVADLPGFKVTLPSGQTADSAQAAQVLMTTLHH